jgi:hypothetical protein
MFVPNSRQIEEVRYERGGGPVQTNFRYCDAQPGLLSSHHSVALSPLHEVERHTRITSPE